MTRFGTRSRHRQSLRAALRVLVRFRIEDSAGWDEGWTRDLSSGGLLLSCGKAPPAGTGLDLELPLAGWPSPGTLTLRALVRRLRSDPEAREHPRYLLALTFSALPATTRDDLDGYVKRLLGDLVRRVRELRAFDGLSDSDLVSLASVCHVLELGAGETLVQQGDEGSSLFIVTGGRVKLVGRRSPPDAATVEIVGPGQIFDGLRPESGSSEGLDVAALDDAVLLALPRSGREYLRTATPDTELRLVEALQRASGGCPPQGASRRSRQID